MITARTQIVDNHRARIYHSKGIDVRKFSQIFKPGSDDNFNLKTLA